MQRVRDSIEKHEYEVSLRKKLESQIYEEDSLEMLSFYRYVYFRVDYSNGSISKGAVNTLSGIVPGGYSPGWIKYTEYSIAVLETGRVPFTVIFRSHTSLSEVRLFARTGNSE